MQLYSLVIQILKTLFLFSTSYYKLRMSKLYMLKSGTGITTLQLDRKHNSAISGIKQLMVTGSGEVTEKEQEMQDEEMQDEEVAILYNT